MSAHDIICVHTMVGYLKSTDSMFRSGGYSGTESHFGVGGRWGADADAGLDGRAYQWQDTVYEADANLDGHWHVISIETADNAPSRVEDIAEWTPRQCTTIARIIAWACDVYDIPAVLIPDTRRGRRGIAYHRQGCEHSDGIGSHPGWLVSGGERWSGAVGKGCPGPRRIRQLSDVIIPMVREILNPSTPEAPVADEIQTGVLAALNTEQPIFPYLDARFNEPDNKMTPWQAIQHGAGQSHAANEAANNALEAAEAAGAEIRALKEQVQDLRTTQAAIVANQAAQDVVLQEILRRLPAPTA